MEKLEVGKKVLLKAIGNNARRYSDGEHVEEWEIKKIGNKYYDVWRDNIERTTTKIKIEDNIEKSNFAGWKAYFSYQEIEEEKEGKLIIKELGNLFSSYGSINLSLDQLRKIKEIINPLK
jgi:hypothetical protein